MTTSEFYYLILVLGAFGAFGAGMSVATLQYKHWLRGRIATASATSAPLANAGATIRRHAVAKAVEVA